MAIMVTDPRNNLLSQLTAVGQQYLAGKQQERMSALDFANRKSLIELMDRLGGQADVREFGQEKELAALTQANQLGLLDAAGKARLAELGMTTGSAERIAQIGATGAVDAARASQPPKGAAPESTISQLTALVGLLRGPQPGDEGGRSPLIPTPFSIPPDLQSDVANYVGSDFLAKIQESANDPNALRAIETELTTSPLRLFRGPGTQAKLLKLIQDRTAELERVGAAVQTRELGMGDVTGAAQLLQLLR